MGSRRIGEAANPGPPRPRREGLIKDPPPERSWNKERESDQHFRVDSVNLTHRSAKPKALAAEGGPVGRGSAAVLYAEAPPIQLLQEHNLYRRVTGWSPVLPVTFAPFFIYFLPET